MSQAIVTHNALLRAGYNDTANRLALNYIVPVMTRKGYYVALLKGIAPKICASDDLQIRALALCLNHLQENLDCKLVIWIQRYNPSNNRSVFRNDRG